MADEQQIDTLDALAAALGEEEGQAENAPDDAQPGADDRGDGETPADAQDEAEEAEESADAATDDDGQAQAPSDDAVIKWNTPGGEVEASLSELKSGYLRQADYTQKTQQLSEERKQAAQQLQQQVQSIGQMSQDVASLMQLQANLKQFDGIDWNAAYQQDPTEAGRLHAMWQQTDYAAKQLASKINHDRQAYEQASNQERAQQLQHATHEAMQVLQRDIPGFGPETINAARAVAIDLGYSDDELVNLTDPRAFKVLHEAAQWRALQAKKPGVQQQVKAAPPKASKPGKAAVPASKQEAAWRNMQAKGDVNSLAAFIAATE